jgi:proline dehydrogenase
MQIIKKPFLWASENKWLQNHLTQYKFVQKAVKRFIPANTLEEAISSAKSFEGKKIQTLLTYLGENVTDLQQAELVARHYLQVIEQIYLNKLDAEISLKLTQLGLDLSFEKAYQYFDELAKKANHHGINIWIDMEGSSYTDVTIQFYEKISADYDNVGLCLQAYLYRTEKDLEKLLSLSPKIRLVKGAYNESTQFAYAKKRQVDQNYIKLAEFLLAALKKFKIRIVFATHDKNMITLIGNKAKLMDLKNDCFEFHMLYGINSKQLLKIAQDGYQTAVLISYGEAWFSWYMRRLAERPANLYFVLKNLI